MKNIKKEYSCTDRKIHRNRFSEVPKDKRVTIRVNDYELAKLRKLAEKHSGGNLGLYMLYTALHYDFKK